MTGEQVSPFALTTLQRVKDILFDPNNTIALTGASLTSGSVSVTGLAVPTGKSIMVGQTITGTGIPAGTTIAAIVSATQITLSANATATNTGQTLTVVDQTTAFDTVLTRYINWATNYINNECGRSSFVQQEYVHDTYSIASPRQSFLILRNTPVFPKKIALTTCITANGSTSVTGITVPAGKTLLAGMAVSGTGITPGTTIDTVVSSTQITLSQAATANGTVALSAWDVAHMESFQWRAGTPSNPNWTDFIADQYELVDPRVDPVSGIPWFPSGMVRVYGVLPRIYNNMIRASYTAGYPVNWSNPEDHNTHWLPGDITGVCENMVVRRFRRRNLAGKTSEAIAGATISWNKELDNEDLDVIGQYRIMNW